MTSVSTTDLHTTALGEALELWATSLVERIQLAVAEVLDGQIQPAKLMSEQRVCAELLGVSTKTLRDRLLPLGLPHHLIGDMRRYDPDEVLLWMRARREAEHTANAAPIPPTPPPPNAMPRARTHRRPAGGKP